MMVERHRHTGLGGDAERIDYNDLKNKPETSIAKLPVIGFQTIPQATSTGLYDIVCSEFSFIPRFIRIQAVMELGRINGYSDMSTDGTNSGGAGYEGFDTSDDGGIWFDSKTRLIRVAGSDTGTQYNLNANFDSFIAGGVKIDITSNDSVSDIEIIVTAYE